VEGTVSENATRTTVDKLYDAYRRRDVDSFAALLHDDIDWVIYGPIDVFPFAGQRRGRAAVLQAIAELSSRYSLESHNPEMQIVEGDRAAVMADVGFKQLASGRILRFRVANFLRIQDGQLIEFREFADSFDLVEQAIGHAVEI
jgi:ketosteroid isomerase-like protein